MAFIDIAKNRYSSRKYDSKEIEESKLQNILEAARIAPSAKNTQPWDFVVVREKSMLDKIKNCYQRDWIKSAPCIIVACGNHNKSWIRADGKDHCDIDISIAIDHITLAAADEGLGTCWVCKFNSMDCADILGLPDGIEPIALIPIGYPLDTENKNTHLNKRKILSQIVHWDKF